MRRLLPPALCVLLVVLAGCGGSGSGGGSGSDQQRAAAYAAAEQAFHSGDFDRAINGFRSLGGFRDARRRLAAVEATAGATLVASARSKLAAGHPRAAVALLETATSRYGDRSAAAQALLAQAQRAQVAHHQAQLAGKAPS